MTNPFLKAEVNTAIREIQDNIDEIKVCLWPNKPRSLTLAARLHHLKDVRRNLKTNPRRDAD
jgi:hypothetical protein